MQQRRGFLCVLLAALLWAPLLGQLHRAAHGHAQAGGAHAHPVAQADHAQSHAHGHTHTHAHLHLHSHATVDDGGLAGWTGFLFGHDDGSQDCRLYDQLTHADALASLPLLALPLLLTAFVLRRFDRDAVARRAALFQPRGPPALR